MSAPENLLRAWKRLSKKKRSRGFDEQTIEEFKGDLDRNIRQISAELRSGAFEFTPLLGRLHEKLGGGTRPIKIPAVRDRVVLKAIQLLISHKFDKYNLPCSFGYVPGRSTAGAAECVRQLAASGNVWVLEADMSKFFDTVNQTVLTERFVRQIRIHSLDGLVRRALQVEVGNLDSFRPNEREMFPLADSGVPQGGVLSPMLANFYLYPFDKLMSDAGFNLVRYADDFVVMCASEAQARSAYALAKQILEGELHLKLHALEDVNLKTRITLYSKGFTFLGLHFQGGLITPASKSVAKFKEKIAAITDWRQGQNLLRTLTSLKNTIEGWGGAYRNYDSAGTFQSLDAHVREQLSRYLQSNGLLGKGQIIGSKQRRFLGVPSLDEIRQRAA
ncbi:MAG: reverse transcriptase domain-containing protein [Candidatus Acidiferrales bacterium]